MEFLIIVLALIVVGIWYESRNPLWSILSSRYFTQWKQKKWFVADTLYVWNDKDSTWFNHVNIEVNAYGIAIYPPFFKRYLSSILIPWENLIIDGKVFKGMFQGLQWDRFARLQLKETNDNIMLAIPYRYKKLIDQYIKSN